MSIVYITDPTNPLLDPYRQLKIIRKEIAKQLFVCEGMLLLERLVGSRFEIHSVVAIERQLGAVKQCLVGREAVPIYVIADDAIHGLVGFNFHRGVLACGYRQAPISIQNALAPTQNRITLLGLPQIQDPGNFGSILRLAGGFGVAGILVGAGCPDPFSRRVLRVSMGGAFRVPVWHAEKFVECMRSVEDQFQVVTVATVLSAAAVPLHKLEWPLRTLLILGREDSGLPTEIVLACSRNVTIPMCEGTDSLNVAVAAGIMLHAISACQG